MEDKDKKLIVDYLSGNTDALSEIVERNLKLVYVFAFRLVRDVEDANDITQETFVKLWRSLEKFNLSQNFRTWLLSIAHNTAIDLLRKKKNFVFSDFDNGVVNNLTEILADPSPLPPEIFELTEKKNLLDDALGQISPLYREVLMLYYEENLTFNEIGVILNKSLNTVKSQHRRALMALKKILESSFCEVHQN